jgi:catechol 2,3-dioxygenase-like lactoylglutathione lyase family enzyme
MNLGFPRWVGVVCDDLESQRRFYAGVLGMHIRRQSDDRIQFDLLPGTTFELVRRPTEPEYDGKRYQVGFTVPDIESATREMIARGVTPISDILGAIGQARWVYFRDPEGNVFEITERP